MSNVNFIVAEPNRLAMVPFAVLLLAIGLTLGTALAAWAGQAAESLVYGLKLRDPLTLGGAVALLAIVALLASYGPAWRAARLQPMDALRDE